jgi:hypothetical protein
MAEVGQELPVKPVAQISGDGTLEARVLGHGGAAALRPFSSFEFTVRYSATARIWMLESIDIDSYSDGDVPPHRHKHLTTADFGHVTFETFDATSYLP